MQYRVVAREPTGRFDPLTPTRHDSQAAETIELRPVRRPSARQAHGTAGLTAATDGCGSLAVPILAHLDRRDTIGCRTPVQELQQQMITIYDFVTLKQEHQHDQHTDREKDNASRREEKKSSVRWHRLMFPNPDKMRKAA